MSSSCWMLIRSRLSDWTGGFIFDRRGTPENSLCRSSRHNIYCFGCVRTVCNFFKIKEKRLWNSLTLLSKFFRLWLWLWVPVSAFGVLSTCWKVMVTITPAAMLMYGREAQSKTKTASPATIPKSGERNRKIHSCVLYLISI